MYAAYRCLSEATGVELSTKAKLEKSDREFLVTSCGTCLRVYEVEKETTLRSIAVISICTEESRVFTQFLQEVMELMFLC